MTIHSLLRLAGASTLALITTLSVLSPAQAQSAEENRRKMMEMMKAQNPAAYEQMKRAEEQRKMLEDARNDPSKMDELMKGPKPDYPELAPVVYKKQMPRPVWSSILDRINFEPNGKYGWEGLTFAFLPEKDESGKDIIWEKRNSIENDQDRLHMEIYHDGEMIADHWMRGTDNSNLTHAMHVNTRSRFTKGVELTHHKNKLEPGKYHFVFKIADDEFYRLKTEVVTVENPDRYADLSEVYVMKGLHDRYLGLSFGDAKHGPFKPRSDKQDITWHLGFRNPKINFRSTEERLFGRLYHEGQEVATMEGLLIGKHDWKMISGNFGRWEASGDPMSSRAVRLGDLTLGDMKNGDYTLVMHMLELTDKKSNTYRKPADADLIEYKFSWKNGQFVLPTYMDDRKTKASDMIEGMGHTIWIEAENGPHPWLLDADGKQPKATRKASPAVRKAQASKPAGPQSGTYTNLEDPEFIRVNGLLEKVSAGEMSFEETGLPEPDPNAQQGPAYTWFTRVKEAKLDYARHMKRKEREAGYAADRARRAKEAEETKAEVAKAQDEAADYAANAEAEAAKARADAEKMMEEMRKKYNLPD